MNRKYADTTAANIQVRFTISVTISVTVAEAFSNFVCHPAASRVASLAPRSVLNHGKYKSHRTCSSVLHDYPLRVPPNFATSTQTAILNFASMLLILVLFICTCAYVRAVTMNRQTRTSFLDSHKHGVTGLAWKAARVGERLSPWVAAACVAMAIHVLIFQ